MITKPIRNALMLAGTMLVVIALVKTAQHTHVISADAATRAGQFIIGLSLAIFANAMPKALKGDESPRKFASLRFSGWVFTLAGLAYALLSLFAPHDIADTLSMAAVAGAMVLTIAYGLWCSRMGQTAK